jgi:Holliday junction resolvase RusA-like endonuclease
VKNLSKTLKQKQKEYQEKYNNIPLNLKDRLEWMYDNFKIDDVTARKIINERQRRMNNLYYTQIKIILYQEPQGAKRPRYRVINRKNVLTAAKADPNFIHVYSPDASYNHEYMKRIIAEEDFNNLEQIICTPCDVEYRAYFPTPKSYNKIDTFMAEIGLDRPLSKPDFDNIEKVYADMYNSNIWLDDSLTIRGVIDKFYSILPRVEIDLNYLNAVYNKKQYNSIINRKDFDNNTMKLDYI